MLLLFYILEFACRRDVKDPCLRGENISSKCIIVSFKQHSGEGTVESNYNSGFHLYCARKLFPQR